MSGVDIDIKPRLLEMLKEISTILRENGLEFYGCGGTVLGAVRHGGFIPWDDDIDVYMFRRDYKKLMSLNAELNRHGYKFVCMENDGKYYLPFGKIIDVNTSLWEFERFPYMIGLYIDIFPLDTFDGSDSLIYCQQSEYDSLYNRYNITLERPRIRRVCRDLLTLKFKDALTRLCYFNSSVRKKAHQKYYSQVMDYLAQIEDNAGDKCVCLTQWMGKIFLKSWFENAVPMKFEDTQILVPQDCHSYLQLLYGDYNILPPVKERNATHNYARHYINVSEHISIEEAIDRLKR